VRGAAAPLGPDLPSFASARHEAYRTRTEPADLLGCPVRHSRCTGGRRVTAHEELRGGPTVRSDGRRPGTTRARIPSASVPTAGRRGISRRCRSWRCPSSMTVPLPPGPPRGRPLEPGHDEPHPPRLREEQGYLRTSAIPTPRRRESEPPRWCAATPLRRSHPRSLLTSAATRPRGGSAWGRRAARPCASGCSTCARASNGARLRDTALALHRTRSSTHHTQGGTSCSGKSAPGQSSPHRHR
jgi:hypothetical protein